MGPTPIWQRIIWPSMIMMLSCGNSPLPRKVDDGTRMAPDPGCGPRRWTDADPRSVPDSRRDPRDVSHARIREYRDGLRSEPPCGFAPGPLVDDPRAIDGPRGVAAPGVVRTIPRIRSQLDDWPHVLHRLGLRVCRIPRTPYSAESPVPREVRRTPDDNQRPSYGRVRPLDGLRRMVLHHSALRREPGDGPRRPGRVYLVSLVEFPDLRAAVRVGVSLLEGTWMARKIA